MKVISGVILAMAISVGLAQAQGSRLIAIAGSDWDTLTGWYAVDTSAIYYSGGRGGDLEVGVNFDSWQGWDWNGTTYNPVELIEQNYNSNNKPIEQILKTWNGNAWVNYRRITYGYDAAGLLSEETQYDWDGNAWGRKQQKKYTYDGAGRILTDEVFGWNGAQIQYGNLETFVYSPSGKVLTKTVQSWNGTWVNSHRDVNTYNGIDSIDTHVFENWSNTTNVWAQITRDLYHYNTGGLLDTTWGESNLQSGWTKIKRSIYTYNPQGRLLDKLSQSYSGGNYTNSHLLSYVDGLPANTEDQTSYSWTSGNWRPNSRVVIVYLTSAKKSLLNSINYSYSPQGSWEVGYLDTLDYNSYQQRTRRVYYEYDDGIIERKSEERYYYEPYQPSAIGTNTPHIATSVFPNPFTINAAINATVTQAGEHTFEVFNMAGQKVHAETRYWATGAQNIVYDGQGLPTGMYIYQISSAAGVAKGKLMKQ